MPFNEITGSAIEALIIGGLMWLMLRQSADVKRRSVGLTSSGSVGTWNHFCEIAAKINFAVTSNCHAMTRREPERYCYCLGSSQLFSFSRS